MYWLYWLFILILLGAAGGAALLAYRTYVMGDPSAPNFNIGGWLFRQRPEPRLGVIEQAAVDSRRRLVLIRRDGVEHLIMTGGPVDVVIETGIQAPYPEHATMGGAEPSPPVFARQPRNLGQAVNE
jgi:flagellar protein FliO/FliZ